MSGLDVIASVELGLTIAALIVAILGLGFAIAAWSATRMPDALSIELIGDPFGDVTHVNGQVAPTRFFHVAVRNSDPTRVARECYAYLLNLTDTKSGNEFVSQTAELTWRGYPLPNASILPNSFRKFDAFNVLKSDPQRLQLAAFLTSSQLIPNVAGTMELVAKFTVVSANFKSKEATFLIHLDSDLSKVTIKPTQS